MEQDDDDDDEEINVHDDDSPLDMRITKHDSDSDVRPSVIRRAPSFKESSSNSPGKQLTAKDLTKIIIIQQYAILDPTSTCDPFIDEHFRRSLGTDYDLILRNKQLEQEQQMALQKQRMLEEQLLIQQQQQAAAALQAQQQQQQQQQHQQQNLLKLKHHKKHQILQHNQAQAMLAAKHSQAMATPPTTPSPPITAQLPLIQVPPNAVQVPQQLAAAANASVPQQKQVIITEHSDTNDMSVDDHFAKALGDTWKKIQKESK